MLVDLALVKVHARVDHDDEDLLLSHYIDAASQHVQKYLDREVYPSGGAASGDDVNAIEATPDIQQAVLLQVATMFDNRNSITDAKTYPLAYGIDELLAPYRRWNV